MSDSETATLSTRKRAELNHKFSGILDFDGTRFASARPIVVCNSPTQFFDGLSDICSRLVSQLRSDSLRKSFNLRAGPSARLRLFINNVLHDYKLAELRRLSKSGMYPNASL